MVGELIIWYLHDKSDSNKHYIYVDVIEDCIDNDKDVIMKLTLCIVRDIVFTTYKLMHLHQNKYDRYWVGQFRRIHDLLY